MKKIFITAFILLLIGCATPTGEKEKIIIEKSGNSSNSSNIVKLNQKVYPLDVPITFNFKRNNFKIKTFNDNTKITLNTFNILSKGTLYAGNGNGYVDVDEIQKDANFLTGRFYFDVAFESNDPDYFHVWHTLDLSNKVGKHTRDVWIYIKVVGYGADGINEQAKFKFKNSVVNIMPVEISSKYGVEYFTAYCVTTDDNGCIQWAYFGSNPYDAKTVLGDPDFHSYRYLDCEIWLWKYSDTNIINN